MDGTGARATSVVAADCRDSHRHSDASRASLNQAPRGCSSVYEGAGPAVELSFLEDNSRCGVGFFFTVGLRCETVFHKKSLSAPVG